MASNAARFRSSHTSQTRPRGAFISARAVGSYVPKLTNKAFEKYGFAAAALITDWAVIVGKDIASYTAPERLKWSRGAGAVEDMDEADVGRPGATLIVRVDPARALDVQYRAQQMIERINGHFGYRAVGELRILQAPLREGAPGRTVEPSRASIPTPPAQDLAGIGDERLRRALTALQSGMTRRALAR
jgi:hypothetical protein